MGCKQQRADVARPSPCSFGCNQATVACIHQKEPEMEKCETCCVLLGVVSFQPEVGHQIRAPWSLSLESVHVTAFFYLALVYVHVIRAHHLSVSQWALQCSHTPITLSLVPFSSGLEVMETALGVGSGGRHHPCIWGDLASARSPEP